MFFVNRTVAMTDYFSRPFSGLSCLKYRLAVRESVSMKIPLLAPLAAVFALLLSINPLAQNATIRLATVVPDGSVWDKNLKQMTAEAEQGTSGRVMITIFNGGSQGDEPAVLRKLRLNSLQAASLTGVGLSSIDSAFNVFNIPFFFQSYDELNTVVEKLTPTLKSRLDSKGFVLLNWGHGGWLQVFSKQPVRTLADLKKAHLWTSGGGDEMTQLYKTNGYNPRVLAMTDILLGLNTGMIDALPASPIAALAFQWNKQAPYMLDIGLTPLVGATVISKQAWNRISEPDRAKILESAHGVETRLKKDVPNADKLSVTLMAAQGLKVIKAEGAEWNAEAEKLSAVMRGKMIPRDIYDMALKERDAFRQRK
jgi:TRAP-type C4-dicarboxylate transport system substrate-binding protein